MTMVTHSSLQRAGPCAPRKEERVKVKATWVATRQSSADLTTNLSITAVRPTTYAESKAIIQIT